MGKYSRLMRSGFIECLGEPQEPEQERPSHPHQQTFNWLDDESEPPQPPTESAGAATSVDF